MSYTQTYYAKNRERIIKKNLDYYYENRERVLARINAKNKTPKGKRYYMTYNWKASGIISDDYNALYDKYISKDCCEECSCNFDVKGDGGGKFRTLHHNHETGEPIAIICQPCNLRLG